MASPIWHVCCESHVLLPSVPGRGAMPAGMLRAEAPFAQKRELGFTRRLAHGRTYDAERTGVFVAADVLGIGTRTVSFAGSVYCKSSSRASAVIGGD